MSTLRITRLLAALALLVVAAACGGPGDTADAKSEPRIDPEEPGLHEGVRLDGDKTYDVYVPRKRSADPVPAVLVLHGMPGDAAEARQQSGMDELAEEEGFLAVYPDNPDGSWRAGPDGKADVAFLRDVITALTDTWGADAKRIYVSGVSNGGDMALTVGAKLPDLVAAVAPVAPAGTGKVADVVAAVEQPVPVIGFLGGNDPKMVLGVQLLETWRERSGCGDAATDEGEQVTVRSYECSDDVVVVTQEVHEGYHGWFGTAEERKPVWASAAMWEFFTEHPGN